MAHPDGCRSSRQQEPGKAPTAARVYQHFVVSEEAAKADLLPGARRRVK
jgi:hypothetical protein